MWGAPATGSDHRSDTELLRHGCAAPGRSGGSLAAGPDYPASPGGRGGGYRPDRPEPSLERWFSTTDWWISIIPDVSQTSTHKLSKTSGIIAIHQLVAEIRLISGGSARSPLQPAPSSLPPPQGPAPARAQNQCATPAPYRRGHSHGATGITVVIAPGRGRSPRVLRVHRGRCAGTCGGRNRPESEAKIIIMSSYMDITKEKNKPIL